MPTICILIPILVNLLTSVLYGKISCSLIFPGALDSPVPCRLLNGNLKHCLGFLGLRFPQHLLQRIKDEVAIVCIHVLVEIMRCLHILMILYQLSQRNILNIFGIFSPGMWWEIWSAAFKDSWPFVSPIRGVYWSWH